MIERAKSDMQRILGGVWGVDLQFTTPDKANTAGIKGLASSHHLSFDPETNVPINVRNTHITVSMQELTDAAYPYLNAQNEVSLKRHYVSYKSRTYLIDEIFPDETLGVITCILGDYVEN